ncbi:MAG: sigma-54-dependent Fis family transcriptional regulator [Bacteriovorax sp.]|nr:sigma-54-dependent Fis family transcriptional regulator [Bacteriovorax sp.]
MKNKKGGNMGERVLDRMVTHSLESSVGLKGVREDDEFTLDLFQDKKCTYRLKRFKYNISTASKFSFNYTQAMIELPFFENEFFEYELVLIKHLASNDYDEKSRYLFRSMGRSPFKLNGVQTFEAFLERGDVVEIGFNRIYFHRPKIHLKLTEENDLLNHLSDEGVKSGLNIMIEGETGTGKTSLAKKIHDNSFRKGKFVHLNLSSFSPGLVESELFGHVKGAFTGAFSEKKGAILEAHKGTLFLDEIDSLSIELQTKLLLFLDSHEFRAVGGSTHIKVDVRLILASGTKLKKLLDENKMRRDFYYRITSGIILNLHSLRDRPEKIRQFCLEFEVRHFCVISEDLIKLYEECSWPGNIRQLQSHLMKKMVLAAGKKIILEKDDYELLDGKSNVGIFENHQLKSLDRIKSDYCLNVFNKVGKNLTKSAKILEISPNTLKSILSNRPTSD